MRFSGEFCVCGSRVFCAFGATGALPPRASRSPARRYERSRTLALDLGKGLTPPLASGVDVLQSAFFVLFACGNFTLSKSCGAKRPHNRPRQRTPSIPNSAFRIPNYPALQIMICTPKKTRPHGQVFFAVIRYRACFRICGRSAFPACAPLRSCRRIPSFRAAVRV